MGCPVLDCLCTCQQQTQHPEVLVGGYSFGVGWGNFYMGINSWKYYCWEVTWIQAETRDNVSSSRRCSCIRWDWSYGPFRHVLPIVLVQSLRAWFFNGGAYARGSLVSLPFICWLMWLMLSQVSLYFEMSPRNSCVEQLITSWWH